MRSPKPSQDAAPAVAHRSRAASLTLALGMLIPLTGGAAESTGMSGDWGGRRAAWSARGVDLDLGYTVEAARNTQGGERRTGAHAGQLSAAARLDLERLWGWKGLRAQASLSLRDGNELGARAGLGTLMQPQEVYGRGHITRLGSLWLAGTTEDGRWDAKLGRLGVGEDFMALPCTAMNLALCGGQPGAFAGDYWFNSPLSQWGGVVTYRPRETLYLRSGAYQVNPRYADTHGGGLRLAPAGTHGTLTPVELGWEPVLNGYAGRYTVGGWYSSAPRAAAVPLPYDAPAGQGIHSGAYGGWASVEQQLSHGRGDSEASGLRGQLALAQGDQRTGGIDRMVNMTLVYTGPWAARPLDQLGVGLASTRVNRRAARSQQQATGGARARAEHVAELFYGAHVGPGMHLQPSVQYVRHPGGFSTRSDAVVVGLKAQLAF